jgi:hypothetical protein
MDVHKDTIVVAVTAAGDGGKATPYGTFPNTVPALEKLVKSRSQLPGLSREVPCCADEGCGDILGQNAG